MGRLEMSHAEHAKIRTSPEVQAELRAVAAKIAAEADSIAGTSGGYGHGDVTVGTDRARAHVWPETPAARRAEAKTSPLMQVVGTNGPA